MRWRVALLLLVLSSTRSVSAWAQGAGFVWSAPEECPGPRVRAPRGLTVRVDIRRTDRGLVATVETRRPNERESTRKFTGSTCDAVVEAAALYLAVAGGYAPAQIERHIDHPPPTGRRIWGQLGAASVGEQGSMPGLGLGLQVAIAIATPSLRIGAEAATYRGNRVAQPGAEIDHGAQFRLVRAGGSGCFRPAGPIWLCAIGELGTLSANTYGTRAGRSRSGRWLAFGAGAELQHRVKDALSVFVSASALVPIRRDSFQFEAAPTLHRAQAVVPRMTIGVSWSLFSLQR